MGLMLPRDRRAAALKEHQVNKAKAHAENHKAAHAAFAKEEENRKAELLPKGKEQPKKP